MDSVAIEADTIFASVEEHNCVVTADLYVGSCSFPSSIHIRSDDNVTHPEYSWMFEVSEVSITTNACGDVLIVINNLDSS